MSKETILNLRAKQLDILDSEAEVVAKGLEEHTTTYYYSGDIYSVSVLDTGGNRLMHKALKHSVKKNGVVVSYESDLFETEIDSVALLNELAEQSSNQVLKKLFSESSGLYVNNKGIFDAIQLAKQGLVNVEKVLIEVARVLDINYLEKVDRLTDATIVKILHEE